MNDSAGSFISIVSFITLKYRNTYYFFHFYVVIDPIQAVLQCLASSLPGLSAKIKVYCQFFGGIRDVVGIYI